MLYISTRDRTDSFTAHRALNNAWTPDGGMFVPMQMPQLSAEEISALKEKSFSEVVAFVLNLFFDKKISGWDIEFRAGRSPFKLAQMNHRLIVAQMWCNHGADYCHFERSIYELLGGTTAPDRPLPDWTRIAIRIAVMFGLFSELLRREITSIDIAVSADDLSVAAAVWYAGNMGLPVGMIVCGCDARSGIWDLIHRGEFTASFKNAPVGVERLIFDAFGREENQRYLDACRSRGSFKLTDEQRAVFESRLFAAVASGQRMESIIKSVARTNDFVLDPDTAVAYGALQDYRARTGESKVTLIMADKNPVLSADILKKILGISGEELKRKVNKEKE